MLDNIIQYNKSFLNVKVEILRKMVWERLKVGGEGDDRG